MNFIRNDTSKSKQVARFMQHGDLVINYMGHSSLDHFYLKHGEIYQNKFGTFYHDDMIGRVFGSKIKSRTSIGHIFLLEPSPELWSLALNTRTQIVNEVDASVITSLLDIYPGCRVVESGTGSGCMTTSLARAVYPTGHVYTFEYNQTRADTAREEFHKIKLKDIITVSHRDICGKFREYEAGFDDIPVQSIDSIFLDLPEPWLALPYARHILKPTRPICCYSPCIEQTARTCDVLRSLGFYNINMIEVRQKLFDGRVNQLENVDLGPIDDHDISTSSSTTSESHPIIDDHTDIDTDPSSKRIKISDDAHISSSHDADMQFKRPDTILYRPRAMPSKPMAVARVIPVMKGHSAFLTFALCPTANMIHIANTKKSSSSSSV